MLAGHLQHVPKTVDANLPCQLRTTFGHHAQQGGKVVDGVHAVLQGNGGDLLGVRDVANFVGPTFAQLAVRLSAGYVSANYVVVSVNAAQLHRELGAYLARGAYHQNIFH